MQQTSIQTAPPAKRVTNAWRHGLCARQVTVREEEREDFEQLRDAMVEQWRPRNVSAWLLVDQLARLQWRLMRAGEAETEKLADLQTRVRSSPYGPDRSEHLSVEKAMADDVGESDSKLARLQLYQMRLERSVQRTLALLMSMRKLRGKRGNLRRAGAVEKSPQVAI